jgi:thiosulfate/3-mercaptopyruvate sulfurtransferase
MSSPPFVSTEWLNQRLDAPDIVVVDGSWYLPTMNRDPDAEYLAGHIPGAVRFDIDRIAAAAHAALARGLRIGHARHGYR